LATGIALDGILFNFRQGFEGSCSQIGDDELATVVDLHRDIDSIPTLRMKYSTQVLRQLKRGLLLL